MVIKQYAKVRDNEDADFIFQREIYTSSTDIKNMIAHFKIK